jgi:hypothetical protein
MLGVTTALVAEGAKSDVHVRNPCVIIFLIFDAN